jgi:hypothetical protein
MAAFLHMQVMAIIFFYYKVDKVVCTHLAMIFGMPIWHPTNKGGADNFLAAQAV